MFRMVHLHGIFPCLWNSGPDGCCMARKQKKQAGRNTRNDAEIIIVAGEAVVKNSLDGRSFLYVGGRDCQVAHLRQIASNFGAELLHHDGGLARGRVAHRYGAAIGRLRVLPDRLYQPRCVSPGENRLQEVRQAFIPLRNGSKSSLERALNSMNDEARNAVTPEGKAPHPPSDLPEMATMSLHFRPVRAKLGDAKPLRILLELLWRDCHVYRHEPLQGRDRLGAGV